MAARTKRGADRLDRYRAKRDFDRTSEPPVDKTPVAPYSVRPAHGAPVSVPITWEELDDPDLTPDRRTISNVGERIATAGDPLAPLIGLQQRLPQF